MEQNDSLWKDSFTYGLILGVALVAYSLILYVAGQTFNQSAGYVVYIILFGIIFWGSTQYREKFLGGVMTYGKSWKIGAVMSVYAGIISAIFTVLLYLVIDPELINQMYEMIENKFLENPDMTDEMIDASMKIVKKTNTSELMPVYALFTTIVTGMLISLLTSIFTRKKENPVV